MKSPDIADRPAVMVEAYSHPGYELKVREIQAGLEEEGVPCQLAVRESAADAVVLACRGAERSQLGVGIGVGQEQICVHYYRLPPSEPLFTVSGQEIGEWRRIGFNAARLVKGIPFKEAAGHWPATDKGREELTRLIRRVIAKILPEYKTAMGGERHG